MHWTRLFAPCYGSIHEGGDHYSDYLVSKAGYVPVSFCAFEVPKDKGHNRDRISLAEEIPLSLGQSKIPEVWPPPPDLQFLDHDRTYFAEFARACDSLMQQHPLGTNAFIQIRGTAVSSMPSIIRSVRYGINTVYVLTNRVSVYVAAPRLGYSITWKPQKASGTNLWALATHWGNTEKVAYTEQR